jgi:DNA-binding HxlR family transcriptional regulator
MRWSELDQQTCSMARTVAVIGDRWTLMILRDCFLRVRRFEDFQARLGHHAALLASRLKKLVDAAVLAKRSLYQAPAGATEYRLTPKDSTSTRW